jgi:hypothetical protein
MASLNDPEVFERLFPGAVAALLAAVANVLTKSFWQSTGHRNYVWFVGFAIALTYALVFVFYLRGGCAGLPLKDFLIVQVFAILMVWGWVDAAFRVINCGLDRSAPTDVAAQVVGVPQRKGYVLTLSAASAFKDVELSVDADVYHRATSSTPALVVTWHKGTLGDGWCGRNPVRVAPH